MRETYFTVGLAGHVDHGKTTLTKALTGVDTDRLKEEKERHISIEPGFAPLHLEEGLHISIIDVPGHERFIRQMIAGVSGIDCMLLVVAADEGVMPQTKEHLEILKLLGVRTGLVVLTKIHSMPADLRELAAEEIREELQGTVFAEAPILQVDSLDGTGIPELKEALLRQAETVPERDAAAPFRLSIDQVFTIKGSGTVVRGTIVEGTVREGDRLVLLPSGAEVRVRQIQVHGQAQTEARAGQRAALNLAGMPKELVMRGHVLAAPDNCPVTETLDVAVTMLGAVKQRGQVKCHIGTAEVMARMVFFDRNKAEAGQEVLCQLRLEEPVAVKRGDRFILRRPSPAETIGGGAVIDPAGQKYRFGAETVELLRRKQEGTPAERVLAVLQREHLLAREALGQAVGVADADLQELPLIEIGAMVTAAPVLERVQAAMTERLAAYHEQHPLRPGMNKAELLEGLPYPRRLLEYAMTGVCRQNGQYVALHNFTPYFPGKWAKRMEHVMAAVAGDRLETKAWDVYTAAAGLPAAEANELYHYLLQTKQLYLLDGKPVGAVVMEQAVRTLQGQHPEAFTIQEAKEVLGLSRKLIIPFLELLDEHGYTEREENKRNWREAHEGVFAPPAARA